MAKDALYVLGGPAVIASFIVRQQRSDRFRERSIPLMLAITLGTQMLVEGHRARAAGIPIAPSRRGRKSFRRQG